MSDVVIQVDGLWKKYRLGVLGTGTLRHDFNRWLHRTLGKADPYAIVGEGQKIEDRRAKSEAKGTKKEDRSSKIAPDLRSPNSDLLPPRSATSPSRSNQAKSSASSAGTARAKAPC
jgi:hypothetical protein